MTYRRSDDCRVEQLAAMNTERERQYAFIYGDNYPRFEHATQHCSTGLTVSIHGE